MTMPKDSPFLSTRAFYENGYDNLPWGGKKNKDSHYYCEFSNLSFCKSSDWKDELKVGIQNLRLQYPNLCLLHDDSLVAHALESIIPKNMQIMRIEDSFWDQQFITYLIKKFGIRDRRTLQFIQASVNFGKPVIWPKGYLRVLNMSYYRSLGREFGVPYWVYVENELSYVTGLALKELNLLAVENVLKMSPEVFKSYFINFLETWECQSFLHPHNDRLERESWLSLVNNKKTNLYDHFITTNNQFVIDKSDHLDFQQRSFPLRGFFKKYLGINDVNFNQLEMCFGQTY
jgi:hypothetical protein